MDSSWIHQQAKHKSQHPRCNHHHHHPRRVSVEEKRLECIENFIVTVVKGKSRNNACWPKTEDILKLCKSSGHPQHDLAEEIESGAIVPRTEQRTVFYHHIQNLNLSGEEDKEEGACFEQERLQLLHQTSCYVATSRQRRVTDPGLSSRRWGGVPGLVFATSQVDCLSPGGSPMDNDRRLTDTPAAAIMNDGDAGGAPTQKLDISHPNETGMFNTTRPKHDIPTMQSEVRLMKPKRRLYLDSLNNESVISGLTMPKELLDYAPPRQQQLPASNENSYDSPTGLAESKLSSSSSNHNNQMSERIFTSLPPPLPFSPPTIKLTRLADPPSNYDLPHHTPRHISSIEQQLRRPRPDPRPPSYPITGSPRDPSPTRCVGKAVELKQTKGVMRFPPPPFSRERGCARTVERPKNQVVAVSLKEATVRLSPPSPLLPPPPRRSTESAVALEQLAEELYVLGEARVALDKRTKTVMHGPPLHENSNQDRKKENGCGKTPRTIADTTNDLSNKSSGGKKAYSKSASSSSNKYAALIRGGGRKQQQTSTAATSADIKKAFYSHWGWRASVAPKQAQLRRESRRCTM